jgi:hypothetical protein
MNTNSVRQQTTRHLSKADKAARLAADIAAASELRRQHENNFRATVVLWQHAAAAGLTAAERYTLDMALARGGDPAYLNTTF